jgi:GntR family transcriptional regulator
VPSPGAVEGEPAQAAVSYLHLAGGTPVVEIYRTAPTEDGKSVEVNRMLLDTGAYVMESRIAS